MKQLIYELKQLCQANKDGSYATQTKRRQVLLLVGNQLSFELGYNKMSAISLKQKHVKDLVKLWKSQGLTVETMKSRMAQLRWWAAKINKQNVIDRSNDAYGIDNRVYVSNLSKAIQVSLELISEINNEYVKASVLLARAFGLRKEEAIKIIPDKADVKGTLVLKDSWCKGGRERAIPILTREQKRALVFAKEVAKGGALIPSYLQYHQQRNRYDAITRGLNLKKLHGLRHQYAQDRYKQLTGWECPHRGGPSRKTLIGLNKAKDNEARLIISNELGHDRIQIVATYIGI